MSERNANRMVRGNKNNQSNNGRSPAKKNTNENCELMTSETPTTPEARDSVHKQNLYIVSFPIIFFFNILRSVLYQFFIVFKYVFNVSAQLVQRPVQRTDNNIEIAIDSSTNGLLEDRGSEQQLDEMAAPARASGPGPADPLLAKQKHHHRRAFEYISRALKIDEENEGKLLRAARQSKVLLLRCYLILDRLV